MSWTFPIVTQKEIEQIEPQYTTGQMVNAPARYENIVNTGRRFYDLKANTSKLN